MFKIKQIIKPKHFFMGLGFSLLPTLFIARKNYYKKEKIFENKNEIKIKIPSSDDKIEFVKNFKKIIDGTNSLTYDDENSHGKSDEEIIVEETKKSIDSKLIKLICEDDYVYLKEHTENRKSISYDKKNDFSLFSYDKNSEVAWYTWTINDRHGLQFFRKIDKNN